jgi:hypothetical protein
MTNISLTIENALEKLQLENEPNVGGFKCSKFTQDGIFVISSAMLYFACQGGDDELKIEKFNYPLIQGIFIPEESDETPEVTLSGVLHKKYIDIKYGHLKIRFHFYQMQDFIKAGVLLQTIIPDKIQNTAFAIQQPAKKNLKTLSPLSTKNDNTEGESFKILPNSAVVSEKFMRVASNTVMNYHVVNLKSKEETPAKEKPVTKIINGFKGDLAEPPTRQPVNELSSTMVRKVDLVNKINTRNDIDKMHQYAKVSDKFMRVASDTIIRSDNIVLKSSPKRSNFNGKKFTLNFIYLLIIFIFFQTPFAKPLKGWMYKFYKQPDKISYVLNYLKIERCEIDMTSIGKIVLIHYKSSNTFPPDLENYINKSFPNGDKKDHSKDPWGNSFIFEKQTNGFKVTSAGPDQKKGTKDDVVKSFNIDYDPSK